MRYIIDEFWTPINGVRRIKYINSYDMIDSYGLIDRNNNIITHYHYDMIIYFDDEVHLAAAQRNGKWGYLDLWGNERVSCHYDYVADRFYCGLAAVGKYGKYGYINDSGTLKFDIEFDEVSIFWDDIATVRKGSKWGAIHRSYTMSGVLSFSYDFLQVLGDGIIVAGKRGLLGFGPMKYCLFNYNGTQLTAFIYDAIGNQVLSNGMIMYKKGATRGYIDKKGNEVQTFG